MSYIALYRKWRPLRFEDVVEQKYVVKALKNTITKNRIGHAYLFCGTRGTGKTTMAKIFSRAVNCIDSEDGNPCNKCDICKGILNSSNMDVIEIDAASNNSVDNVRDIRDEVIYTPSVSKFKVYIIDEVHMLSTGAFNALLKTLEEPPSHVVFILATTEPHKLPITILSRCQRFDFRRISVNSIKDRIVKIASSTETKLDDDAARLIASLADGAMRDAISILEQCIAAGNETITYQDVLIVVGIVSDKFTSKLVEYIVSKDMKMILEMINELVMEGKDLKQFISELVFYYRNLLISKTTKEPNRIIDCNEETLEILKTQCVELETNEIIMIIKELSLLENNIKWSTQPRILLEAGLIKLCEQKFEYDNEYETLKQRLAKLEKRLENGDFVSSNSQVNGNQKIANQSNELDSSKSQKPNKKMKPFNKNSSVEPEYIDFWSEIIAKIKVDGKMCLYTTLLNSKAVRLDENIVGVVLDDEFKINKMQVVKPENRGHIESIFKEKVGFDIRVKCIDSDEVFDQMSPSQKSGNDIFDKLEVMAKKNDVQVNVMD